MNKLQNSLLFKQSCYIDGQWIKAQSGATIDVINPFDQSILGQVPDCGKIETSQAITAANIAWDGWKALSAKARGDYLLNWATLIDQNKEDLARIMTLEQGKSLAESRGEIDYANSFITWFAQEGRRIYGDVISSNNANQQLITLKQPIGVVAAIAPWNFPAAMITRKAAPALAAGCTIVVKCDKATPFSALALAALAELAGIPKGVFNVITGTSEPIGAEMTANPIVRKLSFTGSTKVGRLLMAQCAPTIKKITLELGGNAPFIVFEDANLDEAVKGAIASKFRNAGQTCVCANRILVQENIYEEFSKRFVTEVKKIKVGDGLELGIDQGPLISHAALDKVQTLIADALTKGAKVICGGKPHSLGGLFFEPTVLMNANSTMQISKEEIFGPIAPIYPFRTIEEAINMANDTEFGLASYFYSKNIDTIWHVAQRLEYGMVAVNSGILSTEVAPFGGVKQSGIGREGSKYGIDPYLEIKYLCMQNNPVK